MQRRLPPCKKHRHTFVHNTHCSISLLKIFQQSIFHICNNTSRSIAQNLVHFSYNIQSNIQHFIAYFVYEWTSIFSRLRANFADEIFQQFGIVVVLFLQLERGDLCQFMSSFWVKERMRQTMEGHIRSLPKSNQCQNVHCTTSESGGYDAFDLVQKRHKPSGASQIAPGSRRVLQEKQRQHWRWQL